MKSASISVVIPTYNAERFLAETLRSVLAQTLAADEVLVVDDGSQDGTAAIAESFGAPVRLIRKPNSGPSPTRNFGVKAAASEWVAFVDADDLWEPEKLALQMQELARHPEADLCYTARIQLLDDGTTTRLGRAFDVPPADQVRDALYCNTTFLPSSVVVRRASFLESGGFDPAMKYVEDWDLWLRMLHTGTRFAAVQKPLVRHRIHGQSLSHNGWPSLEAEKATFRRHVLPRLPPATRWFVHQRSQSGQEAAAAFVLRAAGDRRCLQTMASSIFRWPFNEPHRYKVLTHMLLTRLRDPKPSTTS